MTQREKILKHLLQGNELSELDSIKLGFGTSMRSRISELRSAEYGNYPILDKWCENKHGRHKSYYIDPKYLDSLKASA
jgi:hypothetical protein